MGVNVLISDLRIPACLTYRGTWQEDLAKKASGIDYTHEPAKVRLKQHFPGDRLAGVLEKTLPQLTHKANGIVLIPGKAAYRDTLPAYQWRLVGSTVAQADLIRHLGANPSAK